jgi:hypothetical protein
VDGALDHVRDGESVRVDGANRPGLDQRQWMIGGSMAPVLVGRLLSRDVPEAFPAARCSEQRAVRASQTPRRNPIPRSKRPLDAGFLRSAVRQVGTAFLTP